MAIIYVVSETIYVLTLVGLQVIEVSLLRIYNAFVIIDAERKHYYLRTILYHQRS